MFNLINCTMGANNKRAQQFSGDGINHSTVEINLQEIILTIGKEILYLVLYDDIIETLVGMQGVT